MRRLVERAGVDYTQWRALVRALLRVDFGVLLGAQGKSAARRAGFTLFLGAVLYGSAGMMPATIVWTAADALVGATAATTVVAFMVASTLLMGEGSAIVAPDDHLVLGFRPVTSRTYLAVRVTRLLVTAFAVTCLVALPPTIAFLIKDGMHPGVALSMLLASWGAGAAATLGIVSIYGWLLRVAGPARLLRYAAYFQFVAQSLTWLGFVAATNGLAQRAFAGAALSGSPWSLVYPGAWFGSYVNLAAGRAVGTSAALAALSLLLVASLARFIGGKLSLEYGERLSAITATAAPREAARPVRWVGRLDNETRAIAILVRSQLRHNMKFRLALVSLLPITIVYLLLGASGGLPGDPFVAGTRRGNDGGMLQVAIMLLPMTLRRALIASEAFRASWIFHTTPADRGKLVLAARNLVTGFFLVPFLACLSVWYAFAFHNVAHAVVHALFLGAVSYLVLQVTIMIDPQLPFSLPLDKDASGAVRFWLALIGAVVGMGAYFLIILVAYRSRLAMAVAAALIVAAAMLMDRITRRRAARQRIEAHAW